MTVDEWVQAQPSLSADALHVVKGSGVRFTADLLLRLEGPRSVWPRNCGTLTRDELVSALRGKLAVTGGERKVGG